MRNITNDPIQAFYEIGPCNRTTGRSSGSAGLAGPTYNISKGTATQEWNKFEAIRVKRHVISRIISASKRIIRCDAVRILFEPIKDPSLHSKYPSSAGKNNSNRDLRHAQDVIRLRLRMLDRR